MEILDVHRQNILLYLIEQGAHESALKLLKGDNHISHDELNKSLISACQHGYKFIVQMLVQLGANVNYRDTNGNTPLLISVLNGVTDIVKFLLSNKDRNSLGDSALELIQVIKVLLENGASVNDRCRNGETSLMLAAVKEGNMSVMQLLLDHGAELCERDKEGNTALIYAVRAGCFQNVSFLLQFIKDRKELLNIQNGASVNDKCRNGKTPLMLATVKKWSMSVMQLLLDHGAELSERDGEGNTALIHAVKAGCFQNISFLLQFIKDRKELLNIQNGASVNDSCRNGKTPLMLAAVKEGSMRVMVLLLDHGARLSERDGEGNTALIHAVRAGCFQNASFLLLFIKDRKELLNVQNVEGLTALMVAMRVNNSPIIKKLIDAGCDVNCQNNYGHSPLMLAANYCSKDDMCVLLDSGAKINAVSRWDTTKTALTHLRYCQNKHNDYFSCLEYLLDRGASSSYLAETALHKMIVAGVVHVVPKLIRCGLGPVCVLLNDILFFSCSNSMNTLTLRLLVYEVGERFLCSPLCIALCVGNSALARFFVGNLFLTHSDVFLLGHNEGIRHHLTRMDYKECLDILTEITTQPVTLQNLSFVAVSTAVGATPGREIRVNKLPVPQIMKDTKLLFKKQDVALTVPEDWISYEYDYEH